MIKTDTDTTFEMENKWKELNILKVPFKNVKTVVNFLT